MSKNEISLVVYFGGLALIMLGCLVAPRKGSVPAAGIGLVLVVIAAL